MHAIAKTPGMPPSGELTDKVVKAAKFDPDGPANQFVWCGKYKGFGVRVGEQVKSYVVRGEIRRRGEPVKHRRKVIGVAEAPPGSADAARMITIKEARALALEYLGQMRGTKRLDPWADPNAKPERPADAFGVIFEAYLENRDSESQMRASSKAQARDLFSRYLADWADIPYRDITTQMVEDRFNAISRGEMTSPKNGEKIGTHHQAQDCFAYVRAALKRMEDHATPDAPYNAPTRIISRKLAHVDKRKKDPTYKPRHRQRYSDDDFRALGDIILHRWGRDFRNKQSDAHRWWVLFIALTGCRASETSELRWHMVKAGHEVEDGVRADCIVMPHEITKPGRTHIIPMTEQVRWLLTQLPNGKPDDYLFRLNNGNPVNRRLPARKVAAHIGGGFYKGEHSGDRPNHRLRHSVAKIMQSLGCPLPIISATLNHGADDEWEGGSQITRIYLNRPVTWKDRETWLQKTDDHIAALMGLKLPT